MDQRQRSTYESRLYWRIPLIGGWLRRRAASALARDTTPESTHALAMAVTRSDDPRVFSIAMQSLDAIEGPARIDAFCSVWAASRHPALARLQREHRWVASAPPRARVLSALGAECPKVVTGGGAELVEPLVDACHDPDPTIAGRARACLPALESPDAIDEVCSLWASRRSELLAQAVVDGGYVAQQPIQVKVLSALKAGNAERIEALGREVVGPLLNSSDDADPVVNERARSTLKHLTDREAIDEVCRIVIDDNHALARSVALAAGYLPRDDHRRALFFFLTEQWERYEALDFDGRLLRASYEAANPALRERLRETLRTAGRTDFLSVVGGSDDRSRAAVMSPEEVAFLVQMLGEHGEWAKLWRLVFEFAFVWGAKIVRMLVEAGWVPDPVDERATFESLRQLASNSSNAWDEDIGPSLPAASKRAHVRVSGEVNDLAFSTNGTRIALGLRRRRVVVWDYGQGQREQLHGGFDHSIGRVVFTREGSLVCGERSTKPTAECSLFVCEEGDRGRRKLGSHRGAVTAIEAAGDGRVLSTGRDGKVALWDVDRGSGSRKTAMPEFGASGRTWARAARISSDGAFAAVLYDGLSLLQLPGLEFLSSLSWPGTTRCATFSPDDGALIVGQYDGEVRTCARKAMSLENRFRGFCRHEGRVQGIEVLPERSVVVSAGSEGEVRFTSWPDGTSVGRLSIAGDRLNSLRISPDGAFMAVGDSDASMSLWDLRVLDVPIMLAKPLAKAVPVHLAAVRVLAADPSLPLRVRDCLRFVECVLRHRFRYDIEVDDVPGIRLGEFDIEVA